MTTTIGLLNDILRGFGVEDPARVFGDPETGRALYDEGALRVTVETNGAAIVLFGDDTFADILDTEAQAVRFGRRVVAEARREVAPPPEASDGLHASLPCTDDGCICH